MEYTVPHYYKNFQCTASDCEDTCCAGWAIMIDDRSLEKYKKITGPFGNRVHNSIDWKEGCFHQYEGRCAFLNEENLCDLYIEEGKHALCKTCREYPRHTEEYEGLREISLSLSCKEAAKFILGCEEPVRFIHKEDDKTEEYEDFDFFLFTKLMDTRDVLFSILQNRELSMNLRMAMALALVHDVQLRIFKGELFGVDELLIRYEREDAPEILGKKLEKYKKRVDKKELFALLDELEVLKTDWPEYVRELQDILFKDGAEAYEKMHREFKTSVSMEQYEEQLMVYFVFTYFCGAVYDEAAYAKMKLALVSTLIIREMAQAVWQKNGKVFRFEDILEIAHRYSREVEHSDINLGKMEELLTKKKEFGLENLICYLAEEE